jgi:hypothetical protein
MIFSPVWESIEDELTEQFDGKSNNDAIEFKRLECMMRCSAL